MATPTSTFVRLKPKKPLDVWSTREKLCLASAVFKIGDQNWLSVSRAIKPYADLNRPAEWFHQKNCVLQYYDMLEQLEQPKRKRGEKDRSESDPASLQIMRKMTIERSEQLKKEIVEMQHQYKQLQNETEEINAGQWDERIKEEWEAIQAAEKEQQQQQSMVEVKTELIGDDDSRVSMTDQSDIGQSEIDETTQDSMGDISLTDDESMQASSSSFLTSTPVVASSPVVEVTSNKTSAASHLLSSLLKSNVKSATGLQQLKREQEDLHDITALTQTPNPKSLLKTPLIQNDSLSTPAGSSTPADPNESNVDASMSELIPDAGIETEILDSEVVIEEAVVETTHDIASEKSGFDNEASNMSLDDQTVDTIESEGNVESSAAEDGGKDIGDISVKEELNVGSEDTEAKDTSAELDVEAVDVIKEETEKVSQSQDEEEDSLHSKHLVERIPSEAESSIKDEPLSPTSSISSRVSESGSKRGGRGKGRPRSSRASRVSMRKSCTDDGGSSRHSDVELSEDEVRESEDLVGGNMSSVHASSILSESFPNSPASLSMCSDTEEEKSFKQWKKSIMLVWRAAATHKYANVFIHPVTDEIAPGYGSVVLRPMDLTTIKKNLETGVIRTTVEFQRDMMLMFTNAIMYNSSDHNVYRMAQEMYDDVMQHIEIMMQTADAKNTRQSRRPDAPPEKEEDAKKRRLSVDQSESGKTKKRKSGRVEEGVL